MGWKRWKHPLITGCFLAATLPAGCHRVPHSDKPSGKVVATVTYNGKPVTNGMVNFSNPKAGLGGGGTLGQDGTATIDSVVVGEYIVTVSPPILIGGDPNPKQGSNPDLPQQFRSEQTSPLKASVKTGNNEFHFELNENAD